MLRILYGIYFVVLFLFVINALSRSLLAEHGKPIRQRLTHFVGFVLAAIVWPVFLFSSHGWRRLAKMWNDF